MPRHVLITGGSRGIGQALVKAFAAQGDLTAFTYLRSEEAAASLRAETGALPYRCDSRSEEEVIKTCRKILSLFHTLDALVINAGTSLYETLEGTSLPEWQDQLNVHLTGAYLFTRELLPALREKKGAVVYISSVWGQTGGSNEAAYSAAKAGLIGLMKAMAKEAAPLVRFNCVAPGIIDTEMLNHFSQEEKEGLSSLVPLERLGTPEDVAKAALFLCSDNASYITGQTLAVNGGMYI